MIFLDPREPVSAWSHAFGLLLALAVTWVFWLRCKERLRGPLGRDGLPTAWSRFETGKAVAMLIFGVTLVICYGASTVYHSSRASGESLFRLRRLDLVGIYFLIAGTYSPAAWSLLKGAWRRGTLAAVWSVAVACALRVWLGGALPTWASTLIYLAMGWGVVFCYRELARLLGHRTLLPLPVGGAFTAWGRSSTLRAGRFRSLAFWEHMISFTSS